MPDITFLLVRVDDNEELVEKIEDLLKEDPYSSVTERKDIPCEEDGFGPVLYWP